LCCAGKEGAPALEDVCCAGRVATLLLETYDYDVDDATTLALLAWRRYGEEVAEMLRRCSHGRYLAGLGFDADLEFASRLETFPLVAARGEDDRLAAVEP
jgi:phosphosulfolactate phosphohydrolase-like enzyme